MKTYVITLSHTFPKTHSKAGEPTYFPVLFRKKKIHTIRANYPFWARRFEQIEKGNACLSVRMWTGKPYRSPQHELARLTKDDGIGIERLDFYHDRDRNILKFLTVGGAFPDIEDVAKNDGLTLEEWKEWFKNYNLDQPLAVIHFTNFRYEKK